MREDEGLTLLELLVVVILVGILAAIAIPTFLQQRERGWEAQLTADVRNAILDVEAGAVVTDGLYPPDQAAFMALGPSTSSPDITLSYAVSASRLAFCVQGTDARLPAARQVAHYVNAGGLQVFTTCPPL